MTRFARAAGSKSCNKKTPEGGTPWNLLKTGIGKTKQSKNVVTLKNSAEPDKIRSCGLSISDPANSWCVLDVDNDRTCGSNERRSTKRKIDDTDEPSTSGQVSPSLNTSGWRLNKKNSEMLNELKTELLSNGAGFDEGHELINLKVDKFRKEQIKIKTCFKCQSSKHVLADCPESKEGDVCFICGSTEHKFRSCKEKKTHHEKFDFATCFICKEQGHISSSCPDNPSGLYPYGGGCRGCGDVTHFSKNCPKLNEEPKNQITLSTLTNDVEGLPEDAPKTVPKRKTRKINFIKF